MSVLDDGRAPPRPSAGDLPRISVVVPHFNDLDNLEQCLDLLRRQVVAEPFEVVVADNNSTSDRARLEALCAAAPVRLVDAPIQGAAAARNAGVAQARAPLLAFIDSDCRPEPDWLAVGLRALGRAPLVGGRIEVIVGDLRNMTPAEAFERVFAFNNERYIREENFSVTANMFTTRAVFDDVGGFRPGVSEDVDWGQRAAAKGYRWLYEPRARLAHPARRDWPELRRKWRRLVGEMFCLARQRRGHPVLWITRTWMMLFATPMALVKIARSRQVSAPGDRLNAAAVLVRLRVWRFVRAHQLVALRPGREVD